jgi:hypothetical protein
MKILLMDNKQSVHKIETEITQGMIIRDCHILLTGNFLRNVNNLQFTNNFVQMLSPLIINGSYSHVNACSFEGMKTALYMGANAKHNSFSHCTVNGSEKGVEIDSNYPSESEILMNMESLLQYIERKEAKGEHVKSSTLRFMLGL